MQHSHERFRRDTSGATNIEYALMAGVIAITLAAVGPTLKSSINTKLATVSSALDTSHKSTAGKERQSDGGNPAGPSDAQSCTGTCSGIRF